MTSSKQKNRSLYKVTCLITKTRRFAQKQSWNSHPQRCLPWTWRPMESEQIRTGQLLSVCYNYVTHTIVLFCPHRLHIKSPFPKPTVPLSCSLLAHRVLLLNEFVLNSSRCPSLVTGAPAVNLGMSEGKMLFILLCAYTETQLTYKLSTISIMTSAHYQLTWPSQYPKWVN